VSSLLHLATILSCTIQHFQVGLHTSKSQQHAFPFSELETDHFWQLRLDICYLCIFYLGLAAAHQIHFLAPAESVLVHLFHISANYLLNQTLVERVGANALHAWQLHLVQRMTRRECARSDPLYQT